MLGRHLHMRVPTEAFAAEVCFGSKKHIHKSAMRSFICSGDLYSHLVPIEKYNCAGEINQVIESDFHFRSTEAYAIRLKCLEVGHRQRFHGHEFLTTEDVDCYFNYLCKLIQSMQSHGCLSRRHLSGGHTGNIAEFSENGPKEHDIGCVIGPRGDFWMFRTGHHRLHIARKLGISNIPVEVHFVHWRWLRRCLSAYSSNPVNAVIAGLDEIRRSRFRTHIPATAKTRTSNAHIAFNT